MTLGYDDDLVELEVMELVVERDESWLMVIEGEEVWLPKSKCTFRDEDMVVEVPKWLAEKEGLIG